MESLYPEFIGKKIAVVTEKREYKGTSYEHIRLAENDSVIAEIKSKIGSMRLRVWLPGTMGTTDARRDRINVYVEEKEDKSYEVTRLAIG